MIEQREKQRDIRKPKGLAMPKRRPFRARDDKRDEICWLFVQKSQLCSRRDIRCCIQGYNPGSNSSNRSSSRKQHLHSQAVESHANITLVCRRAKATMKSTRREEQHSAKPDSPEHIGRGGDSETAHVSEQASKRAGQQGAKLRKERHERAKLTAACHERELKNGAEAFA